MIISAGLRQALVCGVRSNSRKCKALAPCIRASLHSSSPSTQHQGIPHPEHLLTAVLSGFLAPYTERTPSAEAAVAEIEDWLPDAVIGFDHFAFRTMGLPHLGIPSVARWFEDLGYSKGGAFEFPKKKLRASWYSPPQPDLPRLFVSELKVEEMSPQAQEIIQKYVGGALIGAEAFGRYGPATGFFGVTPWEPPSVEDYRALSQESEYAAWVLVNAYSLNHCTVAVHRLQGLEGGIYAVNTYLKERGLNLSQEGGETKVSPDGLLLQSSTVADGVPITFRGGETLVVPGSYIEFAERLVLPEYAHLKAEDVEEWHRRDGFEAASADKIFESTTAAAQQLGTMQSSNPSS